jgi:hypothetical protein
MLVRGNYRKIPAIVLKLCIPYAGFPLLNPVEFSVFLLCHIILILVDLNIVPFLDFSRVKYFQFMLHFDVENAIFI